MNRESMERRDDGLVFHGQDSAVGYGVLLLLTAMIGFGLIWWFPGSLKELAQPWTRQEWSHLQALAYTALVAVAAGGIAVFGAYLSDRGRRHRVHFDGSTGRVAVVERWRGLTIELDFPGRLFSAFHVHQPVDRPDRFELGVTTEQGAYWRLLRHIDGEALQEAARELSEEFLGVHSGDRSQTPEFSAVGLPRRIERRQRDEAVEFRWHTRERPLTRLCISLASGLFALATTLPLVLVFEDPLGWLMVLLFLASALFGVPLFFGGGKRGVLPFIGAWLGVVVMAAFWLATNFVYFIVASVGLAIFGKSAVHLVQGFWDPELHILRIEEKGAIYQDGRLLRSEGQTVWADQLEGAIVNVTAIRPPKLVLLPPGEGEENRRRHIGAVPHHAEEGHDEPLALKTAGLSLFEAVALALAVDSELRRR